MVNHLKITNLFITFLILKIIATGQSFNPMLLNSYDAFSTSLGNSNITKHSGPSVISLNPSLMAGNPQLMIEFSNSTSINLKPFFNMGISGLGLYKFRLGMSLIGINKEEEWLRSSETDDQNQYATTLAIAFKVRKVNLGYSFSRISTKRINDSSPTKNNIFITRQIYGISFTTSNHLRWAGTFTKYSVPTFIRNRLKNAKQMISVGINISILRDNETILDNYIRWITSDYTDHRFNTGFLIKTLFDDKLADYFEFRTGIQNLNKLGKSFNLQDYSNELLPTINFGIGVGFTLPYIKHIGIDYCFQIYQYYTNQHTISTKIYL